MIVCICRGVSSRDIQRHAQQVGDWSAFREASPCGRQCGKCLPTAKTLYHQEATRQSAGIPENSQKPD